MLSVYDFNGYQLDIEDYLLTDRQLNLLSACVWLVDNKSSLRVTSKNCLVSKSVLHSFIRNELRSLSFELYGCVDKVLRSNSVGR